MLTNKKTNSVRILHKYCTNTALILYKYHTNNVQILCKCCANIVEILYKIRHCMVGAVVTDNSPSFAPSSVTKILFICAQILYTYWTNVIQILYPYCTNIVQTLHKYCTIVELWLPDNSPSFAFICHQNIFSWRAQPNPLTTQNICNI